VLTDLTDRKRAEGRLAEFKGLLRRTEVSVTQIVPPTGCEVAGDDVRLQMMVTNLVRNAAEAIEAAQASSRIRLPRRRRSPGR